MERYLILDYCSRRILGPLAVDGVCVTLRMLMQISSLPSFDVMDEFEKKIVTARFCQEDDTKRWVYSHRAEEAKECSPA